MAAPDLPGLRASPLPSATAGLRSELDCYMWEDGDTVAGSLVYDADLFEPATVARLAARFAALLTEVARNPDARLSDLRLGGPGPPPPIHPTAAGSSTPPSYHQERLWFIDRFESRDGVPVAPDVPQPAVAGPPSVGRSRRMAWPPHWG